MPTSRSDCPCDGCTDRHEACHAKCGLYILWKREKQEIADRIRAARDTYTDKEHQPYWNKYRRDNKRGQT